MIGTTTSVLFGRRKQKKAEKERAAWEQSQHQQMQLQREQAETAYWEGLDAHTRSYVACMQARGYSIG